MSPAEILREVEAIGLHVDVAGDGMRLLVKPRTLLTDELRARLIAAKPRLIAYLAARERLLQEASDELQAHPQWQRAVKLEPDDARGTSYTAGVAVRMSDGSVAVAVMTNIKTQTPFALITWLTQTACEGLPQ